MGLKRHIHFRYFKQYYALLFLGFATSVIWHNSVASNKFDLLEKNFWRIHSKFAMKKLKGSTLGTRNLSSMSPLSDPLMWRFIKTPRFRYMLNTYSLECCLRKYLFIYFVILKGIQNEKLKCFHVPVTERLTRHLLNIYLLSAKLWKYW